MSGDRWQWHPAPAGLGVIPISHHRPDRAQGTGAPAIGRCPPKTVHPGEVSAGRARPHWADGDGMTARRDAGGRADDQAAGAPSPDVLRHAGREWERVTGDPQAWRRALPLDPSGAVDAVRRRALVGCLRAGGDARRPGLGGQRWAGLLAADRGGHRAADARHRRLLPADHQGVPARRRLVHRRQRQHRPGTRAGRRGRPADGLHPRDGGVGRRGGGARHHPRRYRDDRHAAGGQPAGRPPSRHLVRRRTRLSSPSSR
jgi:hypothetical protein